MATEIKMVSFDIQMPHECLNPNRLTEHHWGTVGRHKKLLRTRVADTIRYVYPALVDAHWPAARVQYTFYHAVRRKRDDDNYRSMMKAARDGLGPEKIVRGRVQPGCGLVVDDTFVYDDMPVIFRIDPDERVNITIHKIGADR